MAEKINASFKDALLFIDYHDKTKQFKRVVAEFDLIARNNPALTATTIAQLTLPYTDDIFDNKDTLFNIQELNKQIGEDNEFEDDIRKLFACSKSIYTSMNAKTKLSLFTKLKSVMVAIDAAHVK